MNATDIMKIASEFGFKIIDEFDTWARSDCDDYRFNEEKSKALYTDGDMGVAIIQLSEIDADAGLMVELVDCRYCNFDMLQLGCLHFLLLESQDDIE